jgi:hypothetical protein
MVGACSTHGEMRMRTTLWLGNLEEGDHLEALGVDGRII